MTFLKHLTKMFRKKEAVVGIIGMGYVGIPLMVRYSEVGFKVIGIDVDRERIRTLNLGRSPIKHISHNLIERSISLGFQATTDFSLAKDCDAIIICVPTPLNKYREPDISFIVQSMESLGPYFKAGQVLSLESTTYPGTTEEELLPRLEMQGLTVGENIFLVYSPEREDPGNLNFETQTIPKIVGGHTPKCKEAGIALYAQVIDQVVSVSSTKVAELTKLLENIHRAVNIGLVNEMKVVTAKMGVDIYEVIEAAKSKPFGFTPYYPGPGLGGHCIPIDPFYLTWKAREFGVSTRFIELSGQINSDMPNFVIEKVISALNNNRLPLNGSKLLVLGVAYKKNIDDYRESPSIHIMELLQKEGAIVSYSDEFVPSLKLGDKELKNEVLSEKRLQDFDLVLLITDHDYFDYENILQNARLLVDTRGRFTPDDKKIYRA